MAQTWNDPSLPWQNPALPYKVPGIVWNNPSLPWKAGSGAVISFTPDVIVSTAAVNTAVGTASVSGTTGTPNWSLASSAGGKYAIDPSTGAVTVAASLAAGVDSITISVSGTTPTITDTAFSIFVTAVPANTVAPAITGNAIVGVTLTGTDGTWTGTPTPTFGRQWKVGGSSVTGETNSTYVVRVGDVGSTVTFAVTGTNSAGNAPATSSATAAVTKTTLSYTPTTSATVGTAYTGATPTKSGGTDPYSYSINVGALPPGLTFDTSTGIISGTPTTANTYSGITLTLTDANGITDTSTFAITVAAAGDTYAPSLDFSDARNSMYLPVAA